MRHSGVMADVPERSEPLALPDPPAPATYRYASDERCPIEVLVFTMDPADVDRFLQIDHEVWTLGEAATPGMDEVPFASKEVWLDDSRPGEITIVFVWPTLADWETVADPEFQARLQTIFDERFDRPYELTREIHIEREHGLHRWSRFERT